MANEVQVYEGSALPFEVGTDEMGMEGISMKCRRTPFLKIAQSGSPELKDPSKKIAGLEAGSYYCPQTKSVYGPTFLAVVVKFWNAYAVYDGEGIDSKFQGNILPAEFESKILPFAEFKKGGHFDTRTGYRYVDCRNFLVLPYDRPEDGLMIYSMYSTAIAASKDWTTAIFNLKVPVKFGEEVKNIPVPIYGAVWKLRTPEYVNENGGYYRPVSPEFVGVVDPKTPIGNSPKRLFLENKHVDVTSFQEAEVEGDQKAATAGGVQASQATAGVVKVFGGGAKQAAIDASKDEQPMF